ncbi:hypothetical protein B0A49_12447 [Cryomyces minteri]|uniref:GIT Spa2 homology (SHD) domain-containing protein n=1 Tax=Cryomyces minteri TaxID=331657 RepID=A0A4U0W746_9PEZI|nr:hypothetical protein B0A49_12447 [Cryomyces minteri]
MASRYQHLNGADNPYSPALPPSANRQLASPPASGHTSNSTNGSSPNGATHRSDSNGNPSSPASIARSSGDTGSYPSNASQGGRMPSASRSKSQYLEDALSQHYTALNNYLAAHLRDERGNPKPNKARDKLLRLSAVQFQELSTDVYDELLRREDERQQRGLRSAPSASVPQFLLPKPNFHPKRNQARQKLSTLPLERFRQLATDVFYELERRYPRFAGAHIDRVASPTASVASSGRGPSSQIGSPNSRTGRSAPTGSFNGWESRGPPLSSMQPRPYRESPPSSSGSGPKAPNGMIRGPPNEYGRPLPKTFQSNTIVPNKSTMVEDDESIDEEGGHDVLEDAFGLEDATSGQRRRGTNRSAAGSSEKDREMNSVYQNQVAQLQEKVNNLESQLRDREAEVSGFLTSKRDAESAVDTERSEWYNSRYALEQKVSEAQDLNDALQSELEKLRTSSSNTERGLRAQLEESLAAHNELQSQHRLLRSLPSETVSSDWKTKHEDLEQILLEQQQLTEDVQREAASSLQEMRMLCEESSYALENEERLAKRVYQLESEIEEWKIRHARTRTQLRKLRASSVGPNSLPDAGLAVREGGFVQPEGLVQDVHVTEFQLAIDELLQTARQSADSSTTIDRMKSVVMSVRSITQDIDQALDQPADSMQQLAKLRSRVSATANNLITASKSHASADGLSPVSLLDAAASHLATAVIELMRTVKIRPTPASQLEESEGEDEELTHGRPMAKSTGYFNHTDDTTPQRSRASSRTYSSTSSP